MSRDITGEADEKNQGVDSRDGVMHLNERSVIFNEEMVGERERVTTDEERVLRGGLNRDQVVKIAKLTGCKNFIGKRKKFRPIFNAFVDLKPVERFEDGWE